MWWTPWLWSFRIGPRPGLALDERRLVLAAPQAPPRHEIDLRLDDEHVAQSLTDRVRERGIGARLPARARRSPEAAAPASRPAARGLTRMWPLTSGANALTTSRTAEGKTLTPRTMSMSSVRPMHRTRGPVRPHAHGPRPDLDVIARAEAQERRGAMPEMRQHELAGGAVVQLERARPSRGRSARRGRSRARPGASRPAPRTRPRARRRCRRCPSPR